MKKNILLLLLLVFFSLIFRLGSWGVTETSEARYSEIGREMFLSGDVVHPELLHIQHYHKPPLTYAISALSYKIFGVNAFGARFFLVITLLVQIYCVFHLARRLFPRTLNIGIVSALIYCSMPIVLMATRNLTTDAYLTTFVISSILTWLIYIQDNKPAYLYYTAILLGLGFLTKGPLVLLFYIPFILSYRLIIKPKMNWSWHMLGAFLVFLGIGLSWYLQLIRENPEFLHYFLGTQTVDRVSTDKFGRSKPFWYYYVFGTAVSLPWTPILIYLFFKQKKASKSKEMLGMALLFPLIILSIVSSKLILYIVPLFGGYSILVAQQLIQAKKAVKKVAQRIVIIYFSIICIALIIVPWVTIDEDISISPLFTLLGIVSLIGIWGINYRLPIRLVKQITYSALLFFLLLIPASTFFMSSNQLAVNSMSPITDFIREQNLKDKQIIVYNRLLPSFSFDLDEDIYFINDLTADKNYNPRNTYDLNRDIEFETNDDWKKYYFVVKDRNIKELNDFVGNNSLLVSRKNNNPIYQDLTKNYEHHQDFGKWEVHY